jgi:nicotinamide riboside kinase
MAADGDAMIIAIVGAESTGKSTLARELADRLQAPCIGEALREWCERERRTPRADEQAAIAGEQRRRIEAAATSNPIVVADTTPLMTAVYSELLFADRSLHADALDWHARHVTSTLLTGLDLPWQADGLQRDGAHVRMPVDRLIRDALASRALPYAVVYGHGALRTEAALAALRPLLPQPVERDEGPRFRPRCLECLDPACEQALHRKSVDLGG